MNYPVFKTAVFNPVKTGVGIQYETIGFQTISCFPSGYFERRFHPFEAGITEIATGDAKRKPSENGVRSYLKTQ